MRTNLDCNCEEHRGDIRLVRVRGGNVYCNGIVSIQGSKDWGLFNYCEAAIEADSKRGFTITPIEGHYTCNGSEKGCEGERFGWCHHCDGELP